MTSLRRTPLPHKGQPGGQGARKARYLSKARIRRDGWSVYVPALPEGEETQAFSGIHD